MKSAVEQKDYPKADRAEIAVVGRSNAGKSSLINQILNKKTARISQTPGKTMLLNFYDAGQYYRIVDMPGYGFAKRSNKEVEQWQAMIEEYLANRSCLKGLVMVVDVKRDWQREEENLAIWCDTYGIPMLVALSKADKLKANEKSKAYEIFLKKTKRPCFLVSNTKKTGIKELESYIFNEWVKK